MFSKRQRRNNKMSNNEERAPSRWRIRFRCSLKENFAAKFEFDHQSTTGATARPLWFVALQPFLGSWSSLLSLKQDVREDGGAQGVYQKLVGPGIGKI
jgi:hypothetical protein